VTDFLPHARLRTPEAAPFDSFPHQTIFTEAKIRIE